MKLRVELKVSGNCAATFHLLASFAGSIFEVEKRTRVVPLLYAQMAVATAEVAFLGMPHGSSLPDLQLQVLSHLPRRCCSLMLTSVCLLAHRDVHYDRMCISTHL